MGEPCREVSTSCWLAAGAMARRLVVRMSFCSDTVRPNTLFRGQG